MPQNILKRINRQAIDWEKLFRKDSSRKGLVSRICKELLKPNNKKTNKLILKWAEDLNRHPTGEGIQVTSKHMKRFPHSHVIGEMQVKMIRTPLHTDQNGQHPEPGGRPALARMRSVGMQSGAAA